MKSLIVLAALALSAQAFSTEVTCRAEKAVQGGEANLKADAEINFKLDPQTKTISNVIGHIFVRSAYAESEGISTEDSYMGFFKFDTLEADPNYRPNKYKAFTQYKDFDAVHTAGQEDGMWGALVVDLSSSAKKFEAKYIFKAGDHMGGTVLMNCRAH